MNFLKCRSAFFAALVVLSFLSVSLPAQNINSAYSASGLGEFRFKGLSQNIATGGTGLTLQNPVQLNYLNPASQGFLQLTNFHAGISGQVIKQTGPDSSQTDKNASFAYLTFGFPVVKKNWWGMAFGLLPYTSTGYRFRDTLNQLNQEIAYEKTGTGGINKVFWSQGINPFRIFNDSLNRNFAIGLGAEYYFGHVSHQLVSKYIVNDSSNYLNYKTENLYKINGWKLNLGIIQKVKINPKHAFSLGVTTSVSSRLILESEFLAERFYANNTATTLIDTAVYLERPVYRNTFPLEAAVGICYHFEQKLMFMLDYRMEQWQKLKNPNYLLSDYANSSGLHMGIQFYPAGQSQDNFLKHTYYRAGFKQSTYPNLIGNNGEQLKETAITFGFGIPLRKAFSNLNISLEAGKRGTLNNGLIEQQYLLLNMGMSINDRWFVTSKFD